MLSRLVGRRRELDRIVALAQAPHEESLVIVGEHGMGKTRLLEAAHEHPLCPSVMVRANAAESEWQLSGFSSLLASLNDSRAQEFGGRFSLRSTSSEHMYVAALDLIGLIRGLALDPVLVLVDDVDRMDGESQLLLGFMAGRLAGTGIRLVCSATRVDPGSGLAAVPQLELPPLDFEASLELAAQRAAAANAWAGDEAGDESALRIVAAHSSGWPLAIVDVVDALSPEQLKGHDPLVLPFRAGAASAAAAARSLSGLDDAHLRLLERTSFAPLGNVAGLARGHQEEEALDDLVFNELLSQRGQQVRVKDPLLRSYLFWNADPGVRRAAHAELAEAYAPFDDDLANWHESFAGIDRRHGRALLAGAARLASAGQLDAALEFAERAMVLAHTTGERLEPRVDLASALFVQGAVAHAKRYLTQAQATQAPSKLAASVGARAVQAQGLHAQGPAASTLTMELAVLQLSVDHALTGRVADYDVDAWVGLAESQSAESAPLLGLAAAFHAAEWDVVGAQRLLDTVQPHSIDDAVELRRGTHALVGALRGEGAPDALAFDELAASDAPFAASALMLFGQGFSIAERYPSARRAYALTLSRLEPSEAVLREEARYLIAQNEIRSGNLHQASAAIEEWWRVALPWKARSASRLLMRAWHLHLLGRVDEGRELLAESLVRASKERAHGVSARLSAFHGSMALLEGDLDEAVRLLQLTEALGAHLPNPSLFRHLPDLVSALTALGRVKDAQAVYRSFLDRHLRYPSRWGALTVMRSRAMVAPDEASLGLFEQALEQFEPGDSPFELAVTLSAYADRLRQLGAAEESERYRVAARAAFDGIGAEAWIPWTKAPAVPAVVEESHELLTLLTDEERAVATKVRMGFRNKEIAAALYLSQRTVELRLTHIYRKLGARSRSHLAALLT